MIITGNNETGDGAVGVRSAGGARQMEGKMTRAAAVGGGAPLRAKTKCSRTTTERLMLMSPSQSRAGRRRGRRAAAAARWRALARGNAARRRRPASCPATVSEIISYCWKPNLGEPSLNVVLR
ncbi:hypothetical protein EVAR_71307_1 [Eumeta japonica]|uniref:Uncharacterized protein n=1 Tax=Eumeta variegata TaxID=151549 RepID=A0A4C2AA62_EUMVA|nr:hypothetical protein EVAR_71307_1 [Eumeta japonica]